MAGEMIAMLHGLGGGRRYGLGDIVADADKAFADMDAALATIGGQPAPAYTGSPSTAMLPPDMQMAMLSNKMKSVQNYIIGKRSTIGAPISAALMPRGATGGQFGVNYQPPSNLGTDWSVYALPVGILLTAAAIAWYVTKPKAL